MSLSDPHQYMSFQKGETEPETKDVLRRKKNFSSKFKQTFTV